MRLLLDTHAFLWFIDGSPNLSPLAREVIEDMDNERLLSVASLWEMSIKVSLGKLKLGSSFPALVRQDVEGNAIRLLGIEPAHLEALSKLPFHHRDPFDRMIVAQSMTEGVPVVGRDEAFEKYPVKLIW